MPTPVYCPFYGAPLFQLSFNLFHLSVFAVKTALECYVFNWCTISTMLSHRGPFVLCGFVLNVVSCIKNIPLCHLLWILSLLTHFIGGDLLVAFLALIVTLCMKSNYNCHPLRCKRRADQIVSTSDKNMC